MTKITLVSSVIFSKLDQFGVVPHSPHSPYFVCSKPLQVKLAELDGKAVTMDELVAHDGETFVRLSNRQAYGFSALQMIVETVVEKGHGVRSELVLAPLLYQHVVPSHTWALVSCDSIHRSVLFGLRGHDGQRGKVEEGGKGAVLSSCCRSSKAAVAPSHQLLVRWKHPNAAANCALRASAHQEHKEQRQSAGPYTGKNSASILKSGFRW